MTGSDIILLRKINAVISLITTFFLMDHAVSRATLMLSGGRFIISANTSPYNLFVLMMLHAIISIVLAFLGHKGAKKCKYKSYPAQNRPTIFQRMSGILLIVLTLLHIGGTIGFLTPPDLLHAVLPPVFFAITMAHVAVSTVKAFITLGIGNAKFIKIADVIIKIICIITLIADVIGFYIYLG